MRDHPGTFLVLEGADGSGKTTQFRLLEARLKALGHEVEVFDFPRYDQPSSHFVRRYLNGEYGPAKDVSPYTASLFYALDRFEVGADVKKALKAGKIVLSNRYVGSNMAHQGSKFNDPAEMRGFFVWEDNLEYELLGIPRPSVNIFLRVPAEVSYELIRQKAIRSYTHKIHDEHEADIHHLRKAVGTYDLLCQLFPKDFIAIDCVQNGQLLGIPEISNRIWSAVVPMLPTEKPNPARSLTVRLYDASKKTRTEKTSVDHGQTENLVYKTAGTSLLVLNIAIEAGSVVKKGQLPKEQQNEYYKLTGLPKGLQKVFGDTQQRWRQINKQLEKNLQQYLDTLKSRKGSHDRAAEVDEAISRLTPLAFLVPAAISVSKKQAQALIEELSTSGLTEAKELAGGLQSAAADKWSGDFKSPAPKSRGHVQKPSSIIRKLAQERLPQNLADTTDSVTLLKSWPRNEFEILSSSLYPFSHLGREDIQTEVEHWDYQQKHEALQVIAHNPTNFRHIRYHLDIVCDLNTINELRQSGVAADSAAQPPTPRYGYEVPQIIEDAGLEDLYMEAFDESLKLYSAFQSAKDTSEAGYALLAGHKTRIHFTADAATLAAEFAKTSQSASYRSLLESINIKVAETHPLLWEALSTSTALPAAPAPEKPKKQRQRSNRRRKTKR